MEDGSGDGDEGGMVMRGRVEFFSADCRLCDRTLQAVASRYPDVLIDIHRASECHDGSCCALAERYGVRAVPSLVVDGRVVLVGLPTEQDLAALAPLLRS
jgi:hypothetical protein